MARTPEKNKDLDEIKRIMRRLMPPKPYGSGKKDKSQDKKEKPED